MVMEIEEAKKALDDLLGRARDTLLDWSRDSLKAQSDDERHQADVVFALAKEADDLRRRIVDVGNDVGPALEATDRATPGNVAREKKRGSSGGRRHKADYPKYLRRGNSLVKVGLSKDKKSEYKHVVPDAECRRVIELVAKAGENGTEFTADAVLKGFDGPSYHPYIVLALLRQKKAVVVVRRGTYKLGSKPVSATMDAIWKSLPEETHE